MDTNSYDIYNLTSILRELQARLKLAVPNFKGHIIAKRPSEVALATAIFKSYLPDDSDFNSKKATQLFFCSRRIVELILGYYHSEDHFSELKADIYHNLAQNPANVNLDFPAIVLDIRNHLLADTNEYLSPTIRKELNHRCPTGPDMPTPLEASEMLAIMLMCTMQDVLSPRDAQTDLPLVPITYTQNSHFSCVPPPCDPFYGRTRELERMATRLKDHKHLFLQGLPGFGKSELVKEFASVYHKHFPIMIFFYSSGNLRNDICALDLRHLLSGGTSQPISPATKSKYGLTSYHDQACFETNLRILSELPENSLLIIDNLDKSPEEDELILTLLQLKCFVIVTTQYHYDQYYLNSLYSCIDIGPLEPEELFHLFCHINESAADSKSGVYHIIDTVCSNTLIVKMLAILSKTNKISITELLRQLKQARSRFPAFGKVQVEIEDSLYSDYFVALLGIIFHLSDLDTELKECLKYLSLMPRNGVDLEHLTELTPVSGDDIVALRQAGFILDGRRNRFMLHSLMKKTVLTIINPSLSNCRSLLDALLKKCKDHSLIEGSIDIEFLHIIDSVCRDIGSAGSPGDLHCYISMIEYSLPFFQFQLPSCWKKMTDLLEKQKDRTVPQKAGSQKHGIIREFFQTTKKPRSILRASDLYILYMTRLLQATDKETSRKYTELSKKYLPYSFDIGPRTMRQDGVKLLKSVSPLERPFTKYLTRIMLLFLYTMQDKKWARLTLLPASIDMWQHFYQVEDPYSVIRQLQEETEKSTQSIESQIPRKRLK